MRTPFLCLVLVASVLACREPFDPAGSSTSSLVASRSQGEGDEARAAAHLDLRQVRASLSAASQALSDEIHVEGIVPALGGACAEGATFLSPRLPYIGGAAA